MVDVSHVAKSGMMRAAEISRTPVVATHTACTALCPHPRGLDDEQLDMLRAVGGLAQITAVGAFLKQAPPNGMSHATVADLVDHIEHAVARIGLDHVGISSDFDGGGAVAGWASAAECGGITDELIRRGYGAREIGLLWSGNFFRVWRQVQRLSRQM
jgi:membrane dipeptidase